MSRESTVSLARGALEQARVARRVNQKTIAFDIASRYASEYQSPPIKQVNRAFTGARVTITAAQRIAEALGVSLADLLDVGDEQTRQVAERLRQTSNHPANEPAAVSVADEPAPAPPSGSSSPTAPEGPVDDRHGGSTRRPALRPAFLMLALAVLGVGWLASEQGKRAPSPTEVSSEGAGASDDALVVTSSSASWPVLRFGVPEGLRADEITDALEMRLADVSPLLPDGRRYAAASAPGNADGLIWVTTKARGPVLLVLVATGDDLTRTLVWTDAIGPEVSEYRIRRLAGDITDALFDTHVRGREPAIVPPEALDLYAKGMAQLGEARRELTIRRAQDYFERTVHLAPAWAAAYAQLCHTKMVKYLWSRDVSMLDQAAPDCERAEQLDAESVLALKSSAYLARWRGDLDLAEQKYEQALALDPEAGSVLGAVAELSLDRFRRTGDEKFAARARMFGKRRVAAEPDSWKASFTLGRIAYMTGDPQEAIDWTARAAQIDPNWQVLNNLGTMYFCAGDFGAAREAFLASQDSAPEMYAAHTNLGAVYHALGRFALAAEHFEKALDLRGGEDASDHELRGNYAQALLLAGRRKEAADQFELALGEVEGQIVAVNGGAVPRAYRAYYQAALSSLAQDDDVSETEDFLARELQELEGSTSDPGALAALAFARLVRDEVSLARPIADALAQVCPGYAMAPEFEMLSARSGE